MVIAIAVSGTLTWLLGVLNDRLTRRFRDRVTIALETHVATLQASVTGLEHQERSDYLDRLAVLRNQIFVLDHMYLSVLSTVGWIVRVAVTVVLLAGISPVLVLLVLFALPTVLSSAWRPAVERAVEERQARHARLAEHLFTLGTTAAAGKEVRVTGVGERLPERRRREWSRWFVPLARARWVSAAQPRRRLDGVRRRLRRRHRLRRHRVVGRAPDRSGRGAAHPGRRGAAVGVRRRHHRRDRLPPRGLARRLPAAGLVGAVRGTADRELGPAGAGPADRGHPAQRGLLPLSGFGPGRPDRCRPRDPRRHGAGRGR